jgi:glycerol-3-phosphate O-acyltransferase
MLSMTVRSYLRDPKRPVVFLPVYFGYERVVEANTYISELSGRPKQKESILDLLRFGACCARSSAASTSTSASRSISMRCSIATSRSGARSASTTTRAPAGSAAWSASSPTQVMCGINGAAAVTPVNLLALTLLATPRQRDGRGRPRAADRSSTSRCCARRPTARA